MQFEMSRHATKRALEMEVEGREIRLAVTAPEEEWVSPKHGSLMRRHGRITVALVQDAGGSLTVCTVLWATQRLWQRSYTELPPARGRAPRLVLA